MRYKCVTTNMLQRKNKDDITGVISKLRKQERSLTSAVGKNSVEHWNILTYFSVNEDLF